ncbi:MAG: hypothetical protein Q9M26_04315 [Mariprofundales bacterium]|nr:hypothetical protein [Mariprofundales bacterium]
MSSDPNMAAISPLITVMAKGRKISDAPPHPMAVGFPTPAYFQRRYRKNRE